MTILETDDGYVGYGGTEDPGNIGQMLLFFKIDKQGEEVILETIWRKLPFLLLWKYRWSNGKNQ